MHDTEREQDRRNFEAMLGFPQFGRPEKAAEILPTDGPITGYIEFDLDTGKITSHDCKESSE